MKRLLIILALCCPVWATTYYMRADGTAANAAAATSCSAASTAMNVTTHNAASFSPGDVITLCDSGGVFRDAILTFPSSGSSGSLITYNTSGGPVVSAANLATGWVDAGFGNNTWSTTVSVAPNAVSANAAWKQKGASATGLTEGQWFNSGTTLYYNQAAGNPDTQGTVIESSSRNYAIDFNGQNYLALQNIAVDGAQIDGMYFSAASHDMSISSCNASRNTRMGIHAATGYTTYNITVDSCTVSWNGASGIRINKGPHDWEISRNNVFRNCQIQNTASDYTAYCAGIRVLEYWTDSSSTLYNIVTERNNVYDNGKFVDGTYFVQSGSNIGGLGIWYDVVDDVTGGNVIRYNNVYGNSYVQMQLEHNQNVGAIYNVIHDSAPSTTGLWVSDYSHTSTRYNRNNLIYGNTIYGSTWYGIRMSGASDSTANSCTGNVLKNNISTGNTLNTFFTEYGCQNDGTVGSGNVYLYNAFGTAATNFISWGGTNISTYAAFDTAYASTTHSVAGDPTFTNSAGGNFTLQSSSPAINTGMNLGGTYVQGLNPVSSWPSSVKLLPQSQNSAGWDIGAYIFPKRCMACEKSQ